MRIELSLSAAVTTRKVDSATLKKWEAELKPYEGRFWNNEWKITSAWSVDPDPEQLSALTAKNSPLRVVYNGFHGTSKENGSLILKSGFRARDANASTGGFLGKAFYLASHVDRAAAHMQRLNTKEFYNTSVSGFVFHGDIIIDDKPIKPPKRLTDDAADYSCLYTPIEIGILNPSKQFIVRRVYAVDNITRMEDVDPNVDSVDGFERSVKAASYVFRR
jgi:hypothetical protein